MEDWDNRAVKSLKIESAEVITAINNTGNFELYVFYNDLNANPIAGNADVLREQAQEAGNSLCDISFPSYSGKNNSEWLNSVITGITGSACSVTICQTQECQAVTKNKVEIVEYMNCVRPCDIVLGVDVKNKFSLYTVSYSDANYSEPNKITLIGLFDRLTGVPPEGPSAFFGIPINSPVYPNIVPRFSTLQDLADRMGQVLTVVTSIDTKVTIKYSEGAMGEPGSLLFGIGFEADVQTPPNGISFSSSLQLGDLASVSVRDASFDLLGQISVMTEFGIVFSPDDSSSLKLAGVRMNETSNCNKTAFKATIVYEKNNMMGNETITIEPACDIDGKLDSLIRAFERSEKLKSGVSVSSIGSSGSFVLTFDPLYNFVKVVVQGEAVDRIKQFGIANGDFEKKSSFQFASGLFEILARIEVKGSADITANVADVLEVSAEIDAAFFGQLQFSAGKAGQLIPFDDWLAKLIDMKDTTSEDYDPDFAIAVLTFDGNIAGKVSDNVLGLSVGVTGYLSEPYNFYLLGKNNTGPKFVMDVDLPSFGDLRNLSFGDVINLLQQALELLVGSEEADTVESCSGGLLGKDIFTTKIPVVGVSACDFAGVLQIVVDAVDKLVNECSGCNDSSGTSSSGDPTFQALEVKLTNLLQGMIITANFC